MNDNSRIPNAGKVHKNTMSVLLWGSVIDKEYNILKYLCDRIAVKTPKINLNNHRGEWVDDIADLVEEAEDIIKRGETFEVIYRAKTNGSCNGKGYTLLVHNLTR